MIQTSEEQVVLGIDLICTRAFRRFLVACFLVTATLSCNQYNHLYFFAIQDQRLLYSFVWLPNNVCFRSLVVVCRLQLIGILESDIGIHQ